MECHLCCQPCGFFCFFLKEHLNSAVWVYRSLSSFHSYCSLKFHMLSWVELRGGKHASPIRMFDSETRQSGWAKHTSTTAIFARAPISRVYKKHFYAHFEEYRIADFMETAEFGKKKHLYARLRCFFFLSFSESESMRKTFDGNRSAESTHLTWLIGCLRCLHYNHCITSLSNFGSTTEQAAIFEKRLTFKHCLFEQCGRALPLVYMYTLFKVIVLFSKSHTCSQSLPSQSPNRQQNNKMQFIQGNVFIPTTSVPSDPLSVEQLPQQVVTLHWMLQAS